MPVSAQKLADARKAYSQNHSYDAYRKQSLLLPLLSIIPLVFITFDHWRMGDARGLYFFSAIVLIGWSLCLLIRFGRMRYLKSRYPDNLQLLEDLKQKHGAELPVGICTEVIEEHPLLEYWSRRLEKRAILWRLDAFLSRKPVRS